MLINKLIFIVLMLVIAADVVTTCRLLSIGLKHANPVLRCMHNRLGFCRTLAAQLASVAIAGVMVLEDRVVLASLVAIFAGVTAWNMRVLAIYKKETGVSNDDLDL